MERLFWLIPWLLWIAAVTWAAAAMGRPSTSRARLRLAFTLAAMSVAAHVGVTSWLLWNEFPFGVAAVFVSVAVVGAHTRAALRARSELRSYPDAGTGPTTAGAEPPPPPGEAAWAAVFPGPTFATDHPQSMRNMGWDSGFLGLARPNDRWFAPPAGRDIGRPVAPRTSYALPTILQTMSMVLFGAVALASVVSNGIADSPEHDHWRVEDARAFDGYGLLWLGEAPSAFALDSVIWFDPAVHARGANPARETVTLGYAFEDTTRGFDIAQSPVCTGPNSEGVDENGERAVVGEGAVIVDSPQRLRIWTGGTFIVVRRDGGIDLPWQEVVAGLQPLNTAGAALATLPAPHACDDAST